MTDLVQIVIFALACLGYFCLGGLWFSRSVRTWRIRWIELEHETARALGREPRNIDEVFKA
jgi:hypothetical protein